MSIDTDFFSGINAAAAAEEEHKKTWKLPEHNELRFEVEQSEVVTVKLLSGTAEMFGSEMPRGQEIVFDRGGAGCIYTWHGCEVEVYGKPSHAYVESDTVMQPTCAIHAALEARRQRARGSGDNGPRVMVAGPADTGKSTVARLLLAYAARMQWKPTLVDMDLGAGMIGVPGSFGVSLVEEPPAINRALKEEEGATLQYFYGSLDPDANTELLKLLLEQLAMNVNARQGGKDHERASGCIINTRATARSDSPEYRLLLATVAALSIDVIVVLDQRLFRDLEAAFKGSPQISVVMLKKSGAVATRSEEERGLVLAQRVKEYFYGMPEGSLSPKRVVYGYVDLEIYQVGAGVAASSTMLPIGEESSVDQLALTPVSKSKAALQHALCAISLAESLDEVKSAPVAGYVLISEVDDIKQTITLLTPTYGELPKNILILGAGGAEAAGGLLFPGI